MALYGSKTEDFDFWQGNQLLLIQNDWTFDYIIATRSSQRDDILV